MQFLLYFAVTALLSTFTLAYMGAFKKLNAIACKLGPYTVIYKQWQGDVAGIGYQFRQMEKITRRVFKHADSFGIYYDNPHKIIDKKKMRCVLGIIITNMDAEGGKIERFLKRHKEFSRKELPQVSGFKCTFPYRNIMSFIIGPKRAYSALNQQMQNLEFHQMEQFVAAFEIVRPDNRRVIDFMFIVDESVSEGQDSKYWLTTLPQPDYREDSEEEGEEDEGDEVEEGEDEEEEGEDEIEESEEAEEDDGQNQNVLEHLNTESGKKNQ